MRTMEPFDPSTLPAVNGVPTVSEGQNKDSGLTNGCGALYFLNKSNTGINLVFEDGSRTILPAWFARVYKLKIRSNQLWMSQAYQLNSTGNPISMLYWEAFQQGEDITGLYNGPLTYETNVGNSVPLNASATSVANDGNASGTEVIEASIGGVKHLSVLNDGLTKLLRDTTSANQDVLEFVDVKAGGKDYQFLLLSTGGIRLLNVTDNVIIMDWLPTGALNISGTAIQTSAAGNVFCTGVKLTNLAGGVFTGQTGMGLQAFSKFTGTTTGTYSHGLGITPTHVDPEQHAVGSSSFGWDSETSTQVHITNFNGAAFSAMAYNI